MVLQCPQTCVPNYPLGVTEAAPRPDLGAERHPKKKRACTQRGKRLFNPEQLLATGASANALQMRETVGVMRRKWGFPARVHHLLEVDILGGMALPHPCHFVMHKRKAGGRAIR
jgi:hypothetical protein